MIDLTNQTFGLLTVIKKVPRPENRKSPGAYWLCQCNCGNQKIVNGTQLRKGSVRSCGCLLGQHSIKSEIGNRYGRLVVLEQSTKREYGSVCWLCQCDCGNQAIVAGDSLRNGQTKSCGCLVKEKLHEIHAINKVKKRLNLTGQTFGKLTVIREDTSRTKGNSYWWCKCSCGNPELKNVMGTYLNTGKIKTCGHCDDFEMIGKIFGNLTIVCKDTKKNNNGCNCWLVKCSCGNPEIKSVSSSNLKQGAVKSCGHCKEFETIGKKFGRLTVLAKDEKTTLEKRNRGVFYTCICDCPEHNIITVQGRQLYQGITKSCGCLQKEITAQRCTKDLTNQTFHFLTALYPTEERKHNCVVWHCRCQCGTECNVPTQALIGGHVKSCGCAKNSYGEEYIKIILEKNNIQFQKEKTFIDLKSENNRYYRYDFYLPDYNRLIEFDGEQHFKYTGSGWDTKENFEKVQKSDKIKNEYALSHNIPLVRIPYWERDSITLEMILSDKYLITT